MAQGAERCQPGWCPHKKHGEGGSRVKRPICFSSRDALLPQAVVRGVGVDPCPPAPIAPTRPIPSSRGTRQLVELLRSLVGRELLIQVDSLVHKGKLISVDPVLVVSGDGKVCFIQLEAIKAVDF